MEKIFRTVDKLYHLAIAILVFIIVFQLAKLNRTVEIGITEGHNTSSTTDVVGSVDYKVYYPTEPTTTTSEDTTENEVVEEEVVYFELTPYERTVVEKIVMGEARGESFDGKRLVAQCILNACLKDRLVPSEVRTKYKYSGWHNEPNEEVVEAVSEVFDNGNFVTDENILYFYAPKLCTSEWHETQRYIMTEGNHKFFAEWGE